MKKRILFILIIASLFSGCCKCDCVGLELFAEVNDGTSGCFITDMTISGFDANDSLLYTNPSDCWVTLEQPSIGGYWIIGSDSMGFQDTITMVKAKVDEKGWSPFRCCNCGPYYSELEMLINDSLVEGRQFIRIDI